MDNDNLSIILKSLNYVINTKYPQGIYVGLFDNKYLIFIERLYSVYIPYTDNKLDKTKLPTKEEILFIDNNIKDKISYLTVDIIVHSVLLQDGTYDVPVTGDCIAIVQLYREYE